MVSPIWYSRKAHFSEPPTPPDPVGEFREKPPDLLENKQTAEAFNYQVKQAMDYDVFGETAPPTAAP